MTASALWGALGQMVTNLETITEIEKVYRVPVGKLITEVLPCVNIQLKPSVHTLNIHGLNTLRLSRPVDLVLLVGFVKDSDDASYIEQTTGLIYSLITDISQRINLQNTSAVFADMQEFPTRDTAPQIIPIGGQDFYGSTITMNVFHDLFLTQEPYPNP